MSLVQKHVEFIYIRYVNSLYFSLATFMLRFLKVTPGFVYFELIYYFLCIGILTVYDIDIHPGAYRVQKRALDSLELELQMAINCYVGLGSLNLSLLE